MDEFTVTVCLVEQERIRTLFSSQVYPEAAQHYPKAFTRTMIGICVLYHGLRRESWSENTFGCCEEYLSRTFGETSCL